MRLTTACIISFLCALEVVAQAVDDLPLRISHGVKVVQVQRSVLRQISPQTLVPARKVEVCIVGERGCSNSSRKRLRQGSLSIQVGLPTDTREYRRSDRTEEVTSVTPVRVRVSSRGCVPVEFVVTGSEELGSPKLVLDCTQDQTPPPNSSLQPTGTAAPASWVLQ